MKLLIIIAIKFYLLIHSVLANNEKECKSLKYLKTENQDTAQGMLIEEISWKAWVNNILKLRTSGQQLTEGKISMNLCQCLIYKHTLDPAEWYQNRFEVKTAKIYPKLQGQGYQGVPVVKCAIKPGQIQYLERTQKQSYKFNEQIEQQSDQKTDQQSDQKTDQQNDQKADQQNDQKTDQQNDQKGDQQNDQKTDQQSHKATDQQQTDKQNNPQDNQQDNDPIEYLILKGNKTKVFFKNIYDIYLVHHVGKKPSNHYIIDGILQNVTIENFNK